MGVLYKHAKFHQIPIHRRLKLVVVGSRYIYVIQGAGADGHGASTITIGFARFFLLVICDQGSHMIHKTKPSSLGTLKNTGVVNFFHFLTLSETNYN